MSWRQVPTQLASVSHRYWYRLCEALYVSAVFPGFWVGVVIAYWSGCSV